MLETNYVYIHKNGKEGFCVKQGMISVCIKTPSVPNPVELPDSHYHQVKLDGFHSNISSVTNTNLSAICHMLAPVCDLSH